MEFVRIHLLTTNDLDHVRQLRDIKRKLDEESIKNEELQLEMANLRKKQQWKKRSFSAEVHTTVEQERELTLTRERGDRDDFAYEGSRKGPSYGSSSYRSSYGKSTLDGESAHIRFFFFIRFSKIPATSTSLAPPQSFSPHFIINI